MAVALLAIGGLLRILAIPDRPDRTIYWNAVFDFGHVPLFGFVALLIRYIWVRTTGQRTVVASMGAWLLTAVLAGGTEILQLTEPRRNPSLEDFLRGATGAGAFLLLDAAARGGNQMTRRARATIAIGGAVLIAGSANGLAEMFAIYAARNAALPVLFRLDGSWWEKPFVKTGLSTLQPAASGGRGSGHATMARIDLTPGLYSGFLLDEPYPDWSHYQRLAFTVSSESPVNLSIRIHDDWHNQQYDDRFNRQFAVAPGPPLRVSIPLEDVRKAPAHRQLDMRRIRGIVMFAYQLEHPLQIHLGEVRLE